ncbi:hypothetical protein PLICRDRAFT_45448 [Plicaturopsis crispa FD-325 SS-3]|uniref:DUF6533 domain-containing protein n=1 Tax=Plicaturopsis crispa FD-325 SS-3 TaxID=944288 RepID=A0A0C9T7G2_PLICR|nr:hypothetical protein PLICRDRAFT_45448 [Plicaturopsis crispa FD-325 SS-3]
MSSVAVNTIAAESVAGPGTALSAAIATGLGLLHVLQVYTSCMVTLAVWDWLACLQMEWHRIWKRKFSLVKFLYLWTRYYGLLAFGLNLWLFNGEITETRCKSLHYLIAATSMWVTLGSEAILAVRTHAFLGRKPLIGYTLTAMLFGEMGYLLYVSVAGVHQNPVLVGDKGPCTASDAPGKHVVMGYWIAPVAFDLICMALTGWKALQLQQMGVKSRLATIFVREGLFYFLAVAGVNVLNAAFMFQSNANIQNINSYLALVLSQVLCCRLVLNLRAPDASHSNVEYNTTTPSARFPPASRKTDPNVLPLNSMKRNSYPENDNDYGGVKVQVEVEHDSPSRESDKPHYVV